MSSVFTRRIIAYIIDFLVISAVMWILAYLCYYLVNPYDTYGLYKYFPYLLPILILVYFILCEKIKGATIGKAMMYLEVRSRNGSRINWPQAIVRNLSKIYWFPIIFDWLLGRIFNSDRFLSRFTRTVVVNELR